jgi:hypothetical protein
MASATKIKQIEKFSKTFSKTNKNGIYGSHMPYIFYDLENTPCFLFDVMVNDVWKMYLYNFATEKIIKIPTPTAENITINECNPSIYFDNEMKRFVLSYISAPAYGMSRIPFYGYSTDLENWTWEEANLTANFFTSNKKWIIYSNDIDGKYIHVLNKQNEEKFTLRCNNHILARVTPWLGDDDKFFISVYPTELKDNRTFVILVDLNDITNEHFLCMTDGSYYLYKPSIDTYTGKLYFTHKKGTDFEDREILQTSKFEFQTYSSSVFYIKKHD